MPGNGFKLKTELIFNGRDVRELLTRGKFTTKEQNDFRKNVALVGDSRFFSKLLNKIDFYFRRHENRKVEAAEVYAFREDFGEDEVAEMESFHQRQEEHDVQRLEMLLEILGQRCAPLKAKRAKPKRRRATLLLIQGGRTK